MTDYKLYELTNALLSILEGAATDETGEWESQLETLLPQLKEKAGSCGRAFRYYGDRASMMRERAKVFTEAARAAENTQEKIRKYMERCLDSANLDKIEDGDVTIRFQNNPPKVVIADDAMIPDHLMQVTYTPDKNKIKDELKAGHEIYGVHLEQTRSLRIK